jgi:transposase
MRDTNLLQLALGLTPPWTVTRSNFDPEAKRLDIEIDFTPGSRFPCPDCGAAGCPAYDTEQTSWRHLNFFQHQAYLNARVPRVRCDTCGIRKAHVPWARPDSGFTLLFEALLMTMVSAMPVRTVAKMVGEHDTRLWRVLHHYVDRARARSDASEVTKVAIDETAARAATTTSHCSSISTRPACCSPPRARMLAPSPRSLTTSPHMAVTPRRSARSAST